MIGYEKDRNITLYLEKGEVKEWGKRIDGKILHVASHTLRPLRIILEEEARSIGGVVIERPNIYVIPDARMVAQRFGELRSRYHGSTIHLLDIERLNPKELLCYDLLKGVMAAIPEQMRPRERARDIERQLPAMYG